MTYPKKVYLSKEAIEAFDEIKSKSHHRTDSAVAEAAITMLLGSVRSQQNEPEYLTTYQAAELLKCNAQALRRWAVEGRIPRYQFDQKSFRFKREDVLAFMKPEARNDPEN